MRDPDRLDQFYEELKEIHKRYVPDWRFGQFICNVFGELKTDPFFPEEDRMLTLIKEVFEKYERKNVV